MKFRALIFLSILCPMSLQSDALSSFLNSTFVYQKIEKVLSEISFQRPYPKEGRIEMGKQIYNLYLSGLIEVFSDEISTQIEEELEKRKEIRECNICQILTERVRRVYYNRLRSPIRELLIRGFEGIASPYPEVVTGLIDSMFLLYIDYTVNYTLKAESFCSHHLNLCPTTTPHLQFPSYTPNIEDYFQKKVDSKHQEGDRKQIQPSKYRILVISDIHLDPNYKIGSNANCGHILPCCRSELDQSFQALNISDKFNLSFRAAGAYGDSNCNTPLSVLLSFFHYIQDLQEVDVILWLGDNVGHEMWAHNSVSDIYSTISTITDLFKEWTNIPIIPLMGNHDGYPINIQEFGSKNSENILNRIGDLWREHLGESRTLFKKHGYYSKVLTPGLRVICLNTNQFYLYNFALFAYQYDVTGQLEWLLKILYHAERVGEEVIILGHIPSGSGEIHIDYSIFMDILLQRFKDTVIALFSGHEHDDHFNIVNKDNGIIEYTFGSFSPLVVESNREANPQFYIVELSRRGEGKLEIQEIYKHFLSIPKSNVLNSPMWSSAAFTEHFHIGEYKYITTENLYAGIIEPLQNNGSKVEDIVSRVLQWQYAFKLTLSRVCPHIEHCRLRLLCLLREYPHWRLANCMHWKERHPYSHVGVLGWAIPRSTPRWRTLHKYT